LLRRVCTYKGVIKIRKLFLLTLELTLENNSLREDVRAHITNLTPPPFIEVSIATPESGHVYVPIFLRFCD